MEREQLKMPMVVVRGITVMPTTTVHFNAKKDETVRAVEICMKEDEPVFVVTMRGESEEVTKETLYSMGVIGRVKQMMRVSKDIVSVRIEAVGRAELFEIIMEKPYYRASIYACGSELDDSLNSVEREAYLSLMREMLNKFEPDGDHKSIYLYERLQKTEDIVSLLYTLSEYMDISYKKKMQILEQTSLKERIETFLQIARNELDVNAIKEEMNAHLKQAVSENQKEYVLREQMRLIKQELGEETTGDDAAEYMERLNSLQCPEEVREKLTRDIKRFSNISSMSSESTVLRTYIETLLSYPWGVRPRLSHNLARAIRILDQDHYGLKNVKERVIDTLAVQMLAKDTNAPIICLVGPPGTGKTSIARSIARATNRKYERLCLGGIHDEAELRGHRKTYVGAMPGRVADAMIHAKSENPLILLDEVDKISKDYKGDASAALLEILDSEQNNQFVDHYFELPVDLSRVLFIATANDASQIPRPLLDRMEIIEVNSYTANEKLHIATQYLVGKQIQKNGLNKRQFKIDEGALQLIISAYTKEAGVRNLERTIGKLCQKAARQLVLKEKKSVRVRASMLESLLGPEKYRTDEKDIQDKCGSVTGLAWTAVGGDTLEVEVNILEGRGQLKLTGNLGDVMKESAAIALSHVQSLLFEEKQDKKAAEGKLKETAAANPKIGRHFFEKHDIHVHVPEGATPKDGPSAGITMTTAIYSAVTGIPVRGDIAMTGEVTLRGKVLPIGGLKEKLLAAKMAGKTEVILPEKNQPNVAEIDAEITKGLTLTYVANMSEVLSHALRGYKI
ncbi:MAG: endopeptidase La [Lachnospiraceae bacterium]|nr:endopeptidase La [Lachnospiraceae bacterium]